MKRRLSKRRETQPPLKGILDQPYIYGHRGIKLEEGYEVTLQTAKGGLVI